MSQGMPASVRLQAWLALAAIAALTAASLALPWPLVAALLAASLALGPRRALVAGLAALTIGIQALLLGALVGSEAWVEVGPLTLHAQGAAAGAAGGLRLAALAAGNFAVLARIAPATVVDGLGLPRRARALLAAVALCAHDAGREWRALVDARRLDGGWPRGAARLRAAAHLVPALLVALVQRAQARRDALRLAGIGTGPRFAPTVAVAAAGAVGRLAMVALPNVSLAFVLVFVGGRLFGWRVGAAAGALCMAVTDLMLSGLNPGGLVNVPAMAVVGALGGLFGGVRLESAGRAGRWAGRVLAACLGFALTLAFSVASDVAAWLAVPEYRALGGTLRVLVLAGLAFNVVPAAANGLLFAWTLGPVERAVAASGGLAAPARPPA